MHSLEHKTLALLKEAGVPEEQITCVNLVAAPEGIERLSAAYPDMQIITAALDAAKVNYTMDIFTGVDHGYAFVERAMYDADAAETSWGKIFDMYERCLKPS